MRPQWDNRTGLWLDASQADSFVLNRVGSLELLELHSFKQVVEIGLAVRTFFPRVEMPKTRGKALRCERAKVKEDVLGEFFLHRGGGCIELTAGNCGGGRYYLSHVKDIIYGM